MISTRSFPIVIALVAGLGLSACQSGEERAEEYFQAALALVADGDPARAVVELRNVFNLNGSHLEARRLMADLMLEQGNSQEAYSQYLRLVEQYPDDLEARLALARMAYQARNFEEVERHAAEAVRLAPEDPRVRVIDLVRAYAAAAQGGDDAARRAVARQAATLLAELPDDRILPDLLLDDELRAGDYAAALARIRALLEADPANETYNQQLVAVLAQIGDEEALEAQLKRMVELYPDSVENKATLVRFYLSLNKLDPAEAFLRELADAAPAEDSGSRIDLVRFLIEVRGVEAARAELDAAIAASADPVPLRMIRAGLDFDAGDRDGAVAEVEEVLAGAEPSAQTDEIRVALAKMLAAMGNEVGARARVEEVLAADPSQPEALKMRAAWAIGEDDPDAAIAALRSALDRVPEDAEAMTLMAEAYTRQGAPQLARDFLSLAVEASGNAPAETIRYARVLLDEERYLPAEDILLPALRLAPGNVELLQVLGQVYLGMEDYARVGQTVETLRRLDAPQARQVATELEVARIDAQTGGEEAIGYLEDLAGSADADMASRLLLLRARISTGDLAGAEQMAEEMLAEAPEDEQRKYVLAVTRSAAGRFDEARALYRELIASDPARPAIWRDLFRLALRQGDEAAAEAVIAEGLGHVPDDPELLWGQASLLERAGRIDEAIEVYEALYARDSTSLLVANNLASLLTTYRDDPESLDRAWAIARRLRDTDVPPLQDTYGWIAHRRGDSAEALPYLEAAAAALPEDPLVQYHLGQVYVALDRPDAALRQMQRVVELAGPADRRPQIEEARNLVVSLSGGAAAPDGPAEGANDGAGSAPEGGAAPATDTPPAPASDAAPPAPTSFPAPAPAPDAGNGAGSEGAPPAGAPATTGN